MKKISESFSFGGKQYVYSHQSLVNDCEMTFGVFIPPNIKNPPVLWYLSGLTCSHLNVMEKGEYRQKAADLGMAIVCPDTCLLYTSPSPRDKRQSRMPSSA